MQFNSLRLSAAMATLALASAPAMAHAQTVQFDIPAQPLNKALIAYSKQANVRIAFPADAIKGRTSVAIRIAIPPHDALVRLIAGSGLHIVREDGQVVVLAEEGPGDRANPIDADAIIVSGIRESLDKAVQIKRKDSRIVDVVAAEDIGKLPDNNIAEALQRVPGVAITRDEGVGTGVSIRGLGQNLIQLNGRTTLGGGRDGINFQDMPPELLASVKVIKSPTPKMIEGALGGTIEMETQRPLDLKETVISMFGRGEYGDSVDKTGFSIGGQIGHTWDLGDAGDFGAIFDVSYYDQKLRQDEQRPLLNVQDVDLDNDGTISDDETDLIVPKNSSSTTNTEDRRRLALHTMLQWAPASGNGNFYVDATYTRFENTFAGYESFMFDGTVDTSKPITVGNNGELTHYTLTGANYALASTANLRHTDTYNTALGGEWTFGRLKTTGEVSYVKAKGRSVARQLHFRPMDTEAEAANPSGNNYATADFTYDTTDPDSLPAISIVNSIDINDPSNYVLRIFRDQNTYTDDDEYAGRLDLSYDNAGGPLSTLISSFDFGVRATTRKHSSYSRDLQYTGLDNGLKDANGNPITISATAFSDYLTGLPYHDAFPTYMDVDYGWRDGGVYLAPSALSQDNIQSLRNLLNSLTSDTSSEIPTSIDIDPSTISHITEKTQALYGQFNLDTTLFGIPMTGVVGARWVRTDQRTEGMEEDAETGDYVEALANRTYSDFLPSANLTFDLRNDLRVRVAAAKVMRRPGFGDLSPALTTNFNLTGGSRGNPDLDPYRATQYDLSVEWYPSKSNMISAAVFYKNVASFLRSTSICLDRPDIIEMVDDSVISQTCRLDGSTENIDSSTDRDLLGLTVTTQTNGHSGTVKGLEFAVQQAFDFLPGPLSGLGVIANWTYADSEDPNGIPLENISHNTVNLIGYYEDGKFSTRLAYNYRDKYLATSYDTKVRSIGLYPELGDDDPTLGNAYSHGAQQLDFSAAYKIYGDWSLTLDIVNLTKESVKLYSVKGQLFDIASTDRRFQFGLRGKF